MYKILILLLIVLPLRLLATEIEIVADVNGEPISNLYQFSLLWSQIGNRAELFKCRGRKRGKKFA